MNKEILMVVDAVSNEKGVDKEIIFEAIEAALASATRKRHGDNIDVRVAIDRHTGDYDTFRRWKVFADDSTELEEPDRELRLEDARDINPEAEPDDYVEEPMESIAFGRIAAQTGLPPRPPSRSSFRRSGKPSGRRSLRNSRSVSGRW